MKSSELPGQIGGSLDDRGRELAARRLTEPAYRAGHAQGGEQHPVA